MEVASRVPGIGFWILWRIRKFFRVYLRLETRSVGAFLFHMMAMLRSTVEVNREIILQKFSKRIPMFSLNVRMCTHQYPFVCSFGAPEQNNQCKRHHLKDNSSKLNLSMKERFHGEAPANELCKIHTLFKNTDAAFSKFIFAYRVVEHVVYLADNRRYSWGR